MEPKQTDQKQTSQVKPIWLPPIEDAIELVWWIGRAHYPSPSAVGRGMGDNYIGISGDGLLFALFEVLDPMSDEPTFRFHDFYQERRHLGIHNLGLVHNDRVTLTELVQIIDRFVAKENSKVVQASAEWIERINHA